jgi:thiol-disulfide isomerase/thioredoxin
MTARFRFLSCFLAAVLAINTAWAEDPPAALSIGSKAPGLKIEHWLHADDPLNRPIESFDEGKVYVVEFWATWCGPCIASMPHLAELQRKFRDQGLRIISVSDEDLSVVETFLKRTVPEGIAATVSASGEAAADQKPSSSSDPEAAEKNEMTFRELTSAYSLTTDPDLSVYKDYMDAAGEEGIPTAFIVGKQGIIEWIGHPMELDQPLESILNDQWDREQFIAERAEQMAIQQAVMKVYEMLQQGETDSAIAKLTELIQGSKNPDLVMALRMMQLELLIQIDPSKATSMLRDTLSAEEDAQVLNAMAWSIFELNQMQEGQGMDAELLRLAIQTAEKAVRLAPEDGAILDTLAHLVHISGDLDRAIEIQTKAVKLAPGIEQLQEFLDQLKAEKKDKR